MTDQQSLDGKNLSDRLEILKAELDVILSRMPGYEAELDRLWALKFLYVFG